MIDTAGTFCAAADLLKEKGARTVYGIATHGIFSDPALENIEKSSFKHVIVTNTVPIDTHGVTNKIVVLSVANIIADAISAVANSRSVSALFEGDNQI
jgi:ribose-phosphate pyrophosphokinase